ncbi:MAG: class I SAM-dependent methyltransferase [Gammaproteobacteria bacterium]
MKTEFSNKQYESAYPDGIDCHWWSLARTRIVAKIVKEVARNATSVLEVGCGRGFVVKGLRDSNIDCYGVELADITPVEDVKGYIKTATDAVTLSNEEKQKYETILLLDVIEHISDPVIFLRNLADAFPNLSHIIVTVPARQELWSNFDDFYGHYRRYSLEMLEQHSSDLGFTLKHKGYFFHILYFPALFLTKLNKNRQTDISAPKGLNKIIHKIVSYVMLGDFHIIPKQFVGMSAVGCISIKNN